MSKSERARRRRPITINDIKTANAASGGTWFGSSEMSYFSSIVYPDVWQRRGGVLFITSEAYDPRAERRFSLRLARTDANGWPFGPIETVGGFQLYATYDEAEVGAIHNHNAGLPACDI